MAVLDKDLQLSLGRYCSREDSREEIEIAVGYCSDARALTLCQHWFITNLPESGSNRFMLSSDAYAVVAVTVDW